jgi:Fic family protein
MKDVRGDEKTPGSFRQTQNFIGKPGDTLESATFVPPDPMRLMSDLEDFQRYVSSDDVEALLQTAIVHAQFELIHPFNDGNGRVGRLLIPLFLYQKKKISQPVFYISGYLEAHRETYYARLRGISSPEKDWNGWIEFFLDAVKEDANNQCAKAIKMLELYEEMKTVIYDVTRAHNPIRIQDALFDRPFFQSNEFIKDVGGSPDSARRYLRLLREADIVRELVPKKGTTPAQLVFCRLVNISEGKNIFGKKSKEGVIDGPENTVLDPRVLSWVIHGPQD